MANSTYKRNKLNQIYILLGSNVGNRLDFIQQAIASMQLAGFAIIQQSSVYETAPWGKTNQAPFLNAAICATTDSEPHQTLKILLEIETKLGRKREVETKWGGRTIDLDILFFNNDVIKSPDLEIPHPFIQDRRFVLVPLCEIAPGYIHPIYLQSVEELLHACNDESWVQIFQAF